MLSNLYLFPFDPVTRGLIRCVKGWDATPETPRRMTAAELAPFVGRYENEDGPVVVTADPDAWAALPGDRLCNPADPEVEFRFSAAKDDGFQRLDYVSPLWPVSTFPRTG